MTFDEYQKEAITFNSVEIHNLKTHAICGLVEEVGELCGKLKRDARGDYRQRLNGAIDLQNDLRNEIGDVIWYISDVCSQWKFSLNEIAMENLEKLKDRKERGVIQGKGDSR